MFEGSSLTSLPANFNLPAVTGNVGTYYCCEMFADCTALTSLPTNFTIPQSITAINSYFCDCMFYNCHNLILNANFRLRGLTSTQLAVANVYYRTFYCNVNKTYARQPVSIATILNGTPNPASAKGTFVTYNATQGANRWSDYASAHTNWKS